MSEPPSRQSARLDTFAPVDQDRFVDPDGTNRGNCLQAVVASLLGLPLNDVPHFVQIAEDGGGYWEHLLGTWLAERDLRMNWWLPGVQVDGTRWPDPPFDTYVAISGASPRGHGVRHIVVSHRGQIIHDPHPDRTGIVGTTNAWWLTTTEPGMSICECDLCAEGAIENGQAEEAS